MPDINLYQLFVKITPIISTFNIKYMQDINLKTFMTKCLYIYIWHIYFAIRCIHRLSMSIDRKNIGKSAVPSSSSMSSMKCFS